MGGLAAFIETVKFLKKKKVISHNWKYGEKLCYEGNKLARKYNIHEYFKFGGIACSPYFITLNEKKKNCLEFRTLFIQEMLKNKIMMPWVSIAYRHDDKTLDKTLSSMEKTFFVYKKALKNNVRRYLKGHVIKPVFRKFN